MTRQVKVFDTVIREFWLDLPDDFDTELEDAVLDIIKMTDGLEPVDESGQEIHIYIDDEEYY